MDSLSLLGVSLLYNGAEGRLAASCGDRGCALPLAEPKGFPADAGVRGWNILLMAKAIKKKILGRGSTQRRGDETRLEYVDI